MNAFARLSRQFLSTSVLHAAAVMGAVALAGCDGTPALLPNPDPALRKPSTAFSADAARRTYESSAPKAADAGSRAQYALVLKQIDLTNVSDQDWSNVEVWLNGKYVVFLPKLEKKTDKTLNFQMFFDDQGNHFDTDGGKNPVKTVELFRDGTMNQAPLHVAD